ncbi:tetraacyldisaccharide 4'-kinase [Luteimonas pelagia]
MPRRFDPPAYWYGDAPVPAWARAVEALYGAIASLRRRAYLSGWRRMQRVPAPVVVVGNLVAGGSGKTPLVVALARRLAQAGWRPGIASRGYGRRDASRGAWVTEGTGVETGGDEPVMLARLAGVPVRVDADRVAAARALVDAGCDVVVCDDGLQHYRLARDVEIEVVDGARRYGNGRLLPAGPLREPASRAEACDFRVVNLGGGAGGGIVAGFGRWPMHLRHGEARPLRGGRSRPLSAFSGQRVHAIAGIGHPERFFDMLRAAGIAVVPHAFPDHHAFAPCDFEFGSRLPVLMTEKDAVKCADLAGPDAWVVPVDAELPEAFWVALLERIARARPVPA